jgi:hypothetical protein
MPTTYFYPKKGPVHSRVSWCDKLDRLIRAVPCNIRWGLGWALALATGFSLWVGLLSFARRSVHWPNLGMTTWGIIGGYYLAALLAGPVVGVLRPLTQRRVGTFFIGWVAGTIAYAAVGFVMPISRDLPWWFSAVPGLGMDGVALVLQDDERYGGRAKPNPRFIAGVLLVGAALALLMLAAGWW